MRRDACRETHMRLMITYVVVLLGLVGAREVAENDHGTGMFFMIFVLVMGIVFIVIEARKLCRGET